MDREMAGGEPSRSHAWPSCLPSVTQGAAGAGPQHKDRQRWHAGNKMGHWPTAWPAPPWHPVLRRGWPPTWPVKAQLCFPPRRISAHGRG